jgi:hypothetical protein
MTLNRWPITLGIGLAALMSFSTSALAGSGGGPPPPGAAGAGTATSYCCLKVHQDNIGTEKQPILTFSGSGCSAFDESGPNRNACSALDAKGGFVAKTALKCRGELYTPDSSGQSGTVSRCFSP